MLIGVAAHTGQPLAPHDLWTAWNLDPSVIIPLVAVLWLYRRGLNVSSRHAMRRRAFLAGMAVLAVALVSPLEGLSGVLASAHMIQHVLLVLVAAPLLAFSEPASSILRGMPSSLRYTPGMVRRRLGPRASWLRLPSHPVTVWLLHVGTLWVWHASVVYDATLRSGLVHAAEHLAFLVTALLFWRVVVSGVQARRVPGGLGLLLVFGAAMASVLLSVLLTFASEPWYEGYATTTRAWGMDPLADQQLAGVLMWVPAGAIYVGVALALFASWIAQQPSDVSLDERAPGHSGSGALAHHGSGTRDGRGSLAPDGAGPGKDLPHGPLDVRERLPPDARIR